MWLSRVTRPAYLIVCATLLVALALTLDASEWLRGGYGWRWPYLLAPVARWLPLIGVAALYLAGAAWLQRRTRLLLAWVVLGSVALAAAGLFVRNDDLAYTMFTRTASLLTTGQHYAATHMDWAGGEWQHWTETMGRLAGHMITSSPGGPVFYRFLSGAFDQFPALARGLQAWLLTYQCSNFDFLAYTPGEWASSLFGMLMPLWVGLTALPLYALSKRFVGANARWVAIWWPLIPGLIGFAGSWSTLYPLFSAATFWLLLIGLERRRGILPLILSGVVCGTGIFVNFTLIPLLLFLGLYVLSESLWIARRGFGRAVEVGLWFGVGLIVPWALFWVAGGQTFFAIFATSMGYHFELDRPYWFWVWNHFWDWLLWSGIGFALLAFAAIWGLLRARTLSRATLLSLCLGLTMAIMAFSGTARGETGRVWLFFSPLLLVAAAGGMALLAQPRFRLLSAAQAVYLIALVISIDATSTDLQPPPVTAPQVSTTQAADATFSDAGQAQFRLTGWEGQADGNAIELRLNWQSVNRSLLPYWFGAVLVGPNGETVGSQPWQPDQLAYPTTCWRVGQAVGDTVRLALPADAASGDWWISLAVYPGDSAENQLEVTQPGQAADRQVGLGPIHVGN